VSSITRTVAFGIVLFSFAANALCTGEDGSKRKAADVPRGFYFPELDPHSQNNYVGVFPVSPRSTYYVYGADRQEELIGEISGAPFAFHSGPEFCGWIGLPGIGWFGCGLHPHLSPAPRSDKADMETSNGPATSVRLEKGMSREEVLDFTGQPSRKILMARKEIWEYKHFSLLFEAGTLIEIR